MDRLLRHPGASVSGSSDVNRACRRYAGHAGNHQTRVAAPPPLVPLIRGLRLLGRVPALKGLPGRTEQPGRKQVAWGEGYGRLIRSVGFRPATVFSQTVRAGGQERREFLAGRQGFQVVAAVKGTRTQGLGPVPVMLIVVKRPAVPGTIDVEAFTGDRIIPSNIIVRESLGELERLSQPPTHCDVQHRQ